MQLQPCVVFRLLSTTRLGGGSASSLNRNDEPHCCLELPQYVVMSTRLNLFRNRIKQSLSTIGLILFLSVAVSTAYLVTYALGLVKQAGTSPREFARPLFRTTYWSTAVFVLMVLLQNPPLTRFARRMMALGAFYSALMGATSEYYSSLTPRLTGFTILAISLSMQVASIVLAVLEFRAHKNLR